MTRGAKADAGRAGAGGPGLPQTVTAGLFDLDAVLTNTAAVHHQAWTEMFDAFPRERAERTGEPFVAFDPVADYATYVDGKPRPDGVRDFLASRGITLPEGNPDDGPGMETVHGLGNRRNEALLRRIREQGVRVFEDALAGAEAGRAGGFVVGVDRTGHAAALRTHGADIVAGDLAELLDGVAGEATR